MLVCSIIISSCMNNKNIEHKPIAVTYPTTEKGNVVDDYFGTKIAEPYRWLEYDTAENVKNWVNEENKCTENYSITWSWYIPFYKGQYKNQEKNK